MWFIFAILTTLSWASADLFYKRGADPQEKSSHIRTVIMVGLVMGAHAIIYWIVRDVSFSVKDIILYLPVSALYILSMAVGYFGLRYIALSLSSPVQNSSGAITAVLIFLFFSHTLRVIEVSAIVFITAGIILLAVIERRSDQELKRLTPADQKYVSSFAALLFPVLYSLIDGLGTFTDAIYLDEMSLIGEDQALLAYEFTFLAVALVALVWLLAKGERFDLRREKNRGIAALFETAGQFFYVYAMAQNAIIVAPLIASYSVFSVLLSRIFLKEKLSRAQYAVVSVVLFGILLLGISEVV